MLGKKIILFVSLTLSISIASDVHSHILPTSGDHSDFRIWDLDYFAMVLLIFVAIIFFRGNRFLARRDRSDKYVFRLRKSQFWLGWSVLALTLVTPIDSFGEVLFWVHMVQHELIMLLAAPFLVLSRPFSAIWFGLRPFNHFLLRPLASAKKASWLFVVIVSPLAAWVIHFVGLWGWHLPIFFNASLRNEVIHSFQHISFLLIALIFWYSILRRTRINSAVGLVYLFTTALHASLLGALLTFSPRHWYTAYSDTTWSWGLSPIQDQQLGGLIMWVPSGIAFIVAALYIVFRILGDPPVTSESRHINVFKGR